MHVGWAECCFDSILCDVSNNTVPTTPTSPQHSFCTWRQTFTQFTACPKQYDKKGETLNSHFYRFEENVRKICQRVSPACENCIDFPDRPFLFINWIRDVWATLKISPPCNHSDSIQRGPRRELVSGAASKPCEVIHPGPRVGVNLKLVSPFLTEGVPIMKLRRSRLFPDLHIVRSEWIIYGPQVF